MLYVSGDEGSISLLIMPVIFLIKNYSVRLLLQSFKLFKKSLLTCKTDPKRRLHSFFKLDYKNSLKQNFPLEINNQF